MTSREKLQAAFDLISRKYNNIVREIELDKNRPVLKIILQSEVTVFIRYNDFGEYTYLAIFSPAPDDMIRFDNYDDTWPVSSRPHHFHTQGLNDVIESPMKGLPTNDIPLLLKKIEEITKKESN